MSASLALPAAAGESLGRRMIRAGGWVLIAQFAGQSLRLGSNVVMARLLAPDAFGLVAVVYMLTVALALFSDLGINRSVVQSPRGSDPDLLDTAWTIQALRGGGLAIATAVVAAGLAIAARFGLLPGGTVYADPRLPWLIAVFAVNAAISGLESIRIAEAERRVQRELLTKIDLFSQAAAIPVMILIAWATRSIWALAVGAVFSNTLRVGLGHAFLPGHRERFRVHAPSRVELMRSAKWIFMSSILGFLAANTDRFMLGGMIASQAFGLYAVSFLLVSVLLVVTGNLAIGVAYPAFAEVARERPSDLPRTIAKFLHLFDALIVTLAGVLIVAGPAIVKFLYDQRYHDAGWMLSILAVGAIGMRSQIVEQCYQAVGRPQYLTFVNFIRLASLSAGIWIGYAGWGLTGVLVGVCVSQFSGWPLAAWFLARHHALNWRSHALLVPALLTGMGLGWVVATCIGWMMPCGHASFRDVLHGLLH